MNENILCHIVGMNNKIKECFIEYLNNNFINLYMCDIDEITNEIRNMRKMVSLNNKLNKTKSVNKKKIIKDINETWKKLLEKKLNDEFKKSNNKQIILFGLSTYHQNHRIKIKINTKNLFFFKIDIKKNAKDIVEYNIEKYKDYIIDGTFPIKYIDHEFLIKQREKLIKIYENMGYKMKTLNVLKKWFNLKLDNHSIGGTKNINMLESEHLYVSNEKLFNDKIEIPKIVKRKSKLQLDEFFGKRKDVIPGYKLEWLSLLSVIEDSNKYIKKGFIDYQNETKPFIEELEENAFDKLNKSCYIYKTNIDNFEKKVGMYKYKTYNSISFDEKKYVENIKNKLEELGVKMIKFKY